FDAYVKFIEDDFLGGQRLDPATDGRPDARPTIRENVAILGDLSRDFDFTQTPRAPVVLPVHPKTTLTGTPTRATTHATTALKDGRGRLPISLAALFGILGVIFIVWW